MSGAGRRTADLRDGLYRKSGHKNRWQAHLEDKSGRTKAVKVEQRETSHLTDVERHTLAAERAYGIRIK